MQSYMKAQVPDDYLREIGSVTVTWSLLESVLDFSLMKLSGKDISEPISWIIFAHMTFPLKMDVMGALIEQLQPGYPGLKRYPEVRDLIKEAQRVRNKVVHSKWGFDVELNAVARSTFSARGKLKTEVQPVDLKELEQASETIGRAGTELYRFIILSSDYDGDTSHLQIDPK